MEALTTLVEPELIIRASSRLPSSDSKEVTPI
jgi:hypothetical protein